MLRTMQIFQSIHLVKNNYFTCVPDTFWFFITVYLSFVCLLLKGDPTNLGGSVSGNPTYVHAHAYG